MGRGRNGPIEQSRKKDKKTVEMREGSNWWKSYKVPEVPEVPDKNEREPFSKDFIEALKRMEPQELADILFK